MLKTLLKRNRSFRRFFQNEKIEISLLRKWIENTRYCASARNAQPLKYYISNTEEKNQEIFESLSWAGFLKDWTGPVSGERPAAYIVMIGDNRIARNYYCDHGIAAQTILLSAAEDEFGGCIIASVDRKHLRNYIDLPDYFEIIQVIALGKPSEKVVLEDIDETGNYRYWRSEDEIHHVPKRKLDEIIIV